MHIPSNTDGDSVNLLCDDVASTARYHIVDWKVRGNKTERGMALAYLINVSFHNFFHIDGINIKAFPIDIV